MYQQAKNSPAPTEQEIAAHNALKTALATLQQAQAAVTCALVPVAQLEASRHADTPRMTQVVAEARSNVANAERGLQALIDYAIASNGPVAVGHQMEVPLQPALGGQCVTYNKRV